MPLIRREPRRAFRKKFRQVRPERRSLCGAALTVAALTLALPVEAERCAPHIELEPRWASARFRAHVDAFTDCPVAESTYHEVLSRWLEITRHQRPRLDSLFLGRAVRYPWVSQHLIESAAKSPGWDARRGRPLDGDVNRFVAGLLEAPAFRRRLAQPLADSGLTLSGVSVEKVLVGDARQLGVVERTGRLPFDAQIWLRLVPRSDSE